jgi:hypothetical protein
MTVGTVLSWVLIIFGVIVVVRYLTAGGDRRREVWPTPDELLAERFARGRSTSRSTTNAWMRCTAGPDPCSGPELGRRWRDADAFDLDVLIRALLARPVGAQHPALALDDRPPRRAPQRRPSPPAAGDRRRR